mgnify:FL=1
MTGLGVLDLFSTPGIVTQIASKLPWTDKSIKGLFRLINTEHYRYELQPFAERYIELKNRKRKRMEEIRDRQKKEMYMIKIKPTIEENIRKMVDVIQYCEGHCYKFVAMNALLHYIVDNVDYLEILGRRFRISLHNKFVEVIQDLERLEMFEERDIVIEHRHCLQDYLTSVTVVG